MAAMGLRFKTESHGAPLATMKMQLDTKMDPVGLW